MTSPAMQALREELQKILTEARANSENRMRPDRRGVKGASPKELLAEGERHSPTVRGRKQDQAPEREGHSGRRGDILEDFHKKQGDYANRADDAQPPLIMKITIAGSGCEVWKTHGPKGKQTDKRLARIDMPEKDGWFWGKAPATYAKKKGKGDVAFSGPMATISPLPDGIFDEGKNSINNLEANVPDIVMDGIPKEYKDNQGENVIILLKSHSRGAVAASLVAKKLKGALPKMKVELVQFDPVPGQGNYGEKSEIALDNYTVPEHEEDLGMGLTETVPKKNVDDVKVKLDQTTLVYSLGSGYGALLASFQPQKVHGAKRIIISAQDHGGGMLKGYVFERKTYKGARLNSLPAGGYYETKVATQGPNKGCGILERLTKDNFLKKLEDTYKQAIWKENKVVPDRTPDLGRCDVVKEVLEEFFAAVK